MPVQHIIFSFDPLLMKRVSQVLMFSDDTGWGDPSCFGNPTVVTKSLDRLAAEGLRLTSFYSAAPICSSSRASLLTGRIPLRNGVWSNRSTHLITFGIDTTSGLSLRERTLPQALKAAGYGRSLAVGKWQCVLSQLPSNLTFHKHDPSRVQPHWTLHLTLSRSEFCPRCILSASASCRSTCQLQEASICTWGSLTVIILAHAQLTSQPSNAICLQGCHHRAEGCPVLCLMAQRLSSSRLSLLI
eukprot:SAG31_NODE_621_length_13502_cov_18.057002_12_plen_243_part_00